VGPLANPAHSVCGIELESDTKRVNDDDSMFDIGAIRHELLELLGVPVDVLTPKALPERFRDAVLEAAKPV